MSKIVLYFDGTSPLFEMDDKYNELIVHSHMTYLQDKYNVHKIILVKDVCDAFRIEYEQLCIDDLVKYWYKQEPENRYLNIDVVKLDDGRYKFICHTDN